MQEEDSNKGPETTTFSYDISITQCITTLSNTCMNFITGDHKNSSVNVGPKAQVMNSLNYMHLKKSRTSSSASRPVSPSMTSGWSYQPVAVGCHARLGGSLVGAHL